MRNGRYRRYGHNLRLMAARHLRSTMSHQATTSLITCNLRACDHAHRLVQQCSVQRHHPQGHPCASRLTTGWPHRALPDPHPSRCRRFQSLEPPEIEALQLPETRKAVMALMHPQNLEVNIVGDFDPQQLEQLSLELLGTLQRDPPVDPAPGRPVQLQQLDAQDRRTIWHLKDSDERADGVIAGEAAVGACDMGLEWGGLEHMCCLCCEAGRWPRRTAGHAGPQVGNRPQGCSCIKSVCRAPASDAPCTAHTHRCLCPGSDTGAVLQHASCPHKVDMITGRLCRCRHHAA